MEKRYQVFISSTYEDLKVERKEIIEILLNAKYVPSGMEMFSASNEEQFKYIKKIIDTCDYYVLILGARYGSVNQTSGLSFTEMEYDYALEKNIPVLAFVHSEPENISADKREKENLELFNKFRNKVLDNSKMCKMWKERSELVANVVISLTQIIDEFPRTGWTRGEEDSKDLLIQINQLRKENDALRNENIKLKKKNIESNLRDELACDDDEFEIEGETYNIEEKYDYYYDEHLPFKNNINSEILSITWNSLLKAIAPIIFSGNIERCFKEEVNNYIKGLLKVDNFEISNKSYHIIKYQMLALDWITITNGKTEDNTYIELTDFGKNVFLEKITIKKVR